jgi:Predicted membrane protein (DUF2306)
MGDKSRIRLFTAVVILLCVYGMYRCVHASLMAVQGGSHEFGGMFDYPLWTMAHFTGGAVFLVLMPFQLWAGFRNRHKTLHNRSGRVLFGAGLVLVVTGLALPYSMPARPVSEKVFMTATSMTFAFFLIKAVLAAKRRDFVRHREWMIRVVAVAFGPLAQRIIFPAFPILLGIHSVPEFWEYFTTSSWLSAALVVSTAEWWLHLRTESSAIFSKHIIRDE